MKKKSLAFMLVAALLTIGLDAQAQEKVKLDFRPVGPGAGLALWGIVAWNGLGAGARYTMPLAEGFLEGVSAFRRDTVEVEAGLDFVSYDAGLGWVDINYNVLRPAVGAKWSLWLTDSFAVYPKVELGFDVSWWSGYDWPTGYDPPNHTGIYFDAAAGLLYRLGAKLDLRAEVGIDGLRAGVAFNF